ncbi:iron-containing alcohol dehydrogenase [Enterobacter ludwigii]|nr:iron-containing alcohol dehydrogenase [Enterobacter ludwigii]QCV82211.1 iron-containing alcohol dehydrogenase [Enterobacter ludwigii]QDE52387.1 iron-containing alcohol dehydrogenase [Enterobacter ludwigii]
MNDLFIESLALQRIELMARLVASSDCSDDDKEVAISWLSELTSDLVTRLNEYGVGQYESTH